MKHIILLATAAILSCGVRVQAQEAESPKAISPISKGHITIGTGIGLANFGYGKTTDNQSVVGYDVSLNPSVGYFLTDHWLFSAKVLGAVAGSTVKGNPYSRSAGVGLAARYYFGKPADRKGNVNRFRVFAEAGGSVERFWDRSLYNNMPERFASNAAILNAGIGFNYLLNENVAFETALNGRRFISGSGQFRNYDSRLQLEFGVRVFLNRR